ncbi:DUF6884 domain-containing protein [Rhodococcoides corynebacterioides]|uniref:DUF6884 domain-containing protein n=1 Tax=Rhodococcoides corynebacterioides TaxID=53972 RepID=UPI0021C10C47|nr:DUF6884 domain-containing protein [Rhodococcus corynebacterioides]
MRITLDGNLFDLRPELLRARIDGHIPENIRDYGVEIDGTRWPVKQVISLATGVTDRQRFQSQSSRRWLQKLGFTIGKGNAATPPAPRPAPNTQVAVVGPPTPVPRPQADVVLVGCVKSKRPEGALAKDLYTSDYFAKMRAYAESTERPWFILSAEHGLVSPNDWLEPYNCYLPDMSREYRRSWGQKVATQLEAAVGPLTGVVVDLHAGSAYVESTEAALRPLGAVVVDQLRGLSFGRRLSWYLQQSRGEPDGDLDIVSRLRDGSLAVSLDDLVASGGDGLRSPGMYSWWIDEAGAADLTRGLRHQVDAGLIYAGLAGATRTGGSTSANTLWGRIATMHLGKRHEFSTLRRSLGAVLAQAYGLSVIDEVGLTQWMHVHLRVVAIPVAHADTLDSLETEILSELDPPLNLAKVAKTPLRRQLSALRKRFAGGAASEQP